MTEKNPEEEIRPLDTERWERTLEKIAPLDPDFDEAVRITLEELRRDKAILMSDSITAQKRLAQRSQAAEGEALPDFEHLEQANASLSEEVRMLRAELAGWRHDALRMQNECDIDSSCSMQDVMRRVRESYATMPELGATTEGIEPSPIYANPATKELPMKSWQERWTEARQEVGDLQDDVETYRGVAEANLSRAEQLEQANYELAEELRETRIRNATLVTEVKKLAGELLVERLAGRNAKPFIDRPSPDETIADLTTKNAKLTEENHNLSQTMLQDRDRFADGQAALEKELKEAKAAVASLQHEKVWDTKRRTGVESDIKHQPSDNIDFPKILVNDAINHVRHIYDDFGKPSEPVERKCANCEYFDSTDRNAVWNGHCRIDRPTTAGFPTVEPDDWCGDFEEMERNDG